MRNSQAEKGTPRHSKRGRFLERHSKRLRRDILGGCPVTGASEREGVDAIEVALVQLGEPPRLPLRGFYEPAF